MQRKQRPCVASRAPRAAGERSLARRCRILAASAFVVAVTGPLPSLAQDMDAFVDCLTGSGAVFYGAHWCPACKAQRRLFGSSAAGLNYVECYEPGSRTKRAECDDISGYPTWQFADGSLRRGKLSLATLGRITGCALPRR